MTMIEFLKAVEAISGGRKCRVRVDACASSEERGQREYRAEFSAYVHDVGWTDDYNNPDDAISELRRMLGQFGPPATIESVGEIDTSPTAMA